MFVRFRKTPRRLQASVVETRRAAGKVASEHVASLGSVTLPMTVRGRQASWAHLWDRLHALSNRVGADDQAKIRNAVHARIPMVLPEEATAEEAKYWDTWSKSFAENGARYRKYAADNIERAEIEERVAADFAKNRNAALKGERPDPTIVGVLLAAKVGRPRPDGTPELLANGEQGFVRTPKRSRNDRRRRRGGVRFTPKAVEGWKPLP
jgi:hypothetical protein